MFHPNIKPIPKIYMNKIGKPKIGNRIKVDKKSIVINIFINDELCSKASIF
jgi:hypothetical protein